MSSTPAETGRMFVDTNILVYAHDVTAGPKHAKARDLLVDLWDTGKGCLSIQVVQEFFVVVTRKVPKPLDEEEASAIVSDLARWRVHAPQPEDLLEAIRLHRRADLSFWDAMIVRSAIALGCGELLTEDLGHGRLIEGLRIVDPFQ